MQWYDAISMFSTTRHAFILPAFRTTDMSADQVRKELAVANLLSKEYKYFRDEWHVEPINEHLQPFKCSLESSIDQNILM